MKRFTLFGEGLKSYASNNFGLDQFRFEFEDLGSGQLVARLYNKLRRLGEAALSETYLVSLVAEPDGKSYGENNSLDVNFFSNFELSFVGIEDQDGSQSFGMGSLNLDSGLLSFVENSKALQTGVTASTEMILAAYS